MNSRSWTRLGCVFSVAASMLIGTMGVTKAQGAEIGKFETPVHRVTERRAKAMVRS